MLLKACMHHVDCWAFFFWPKGCRRQKGKPGQKKKMSWAVLAVAFCGLLYGLAFTEDWLGFGDDHPERYLYPLWAWIVAEACRSCCRPRPRRQAVPTSGPTSPPTSPPTRPSPAMERALARQRKQKALVAAMKAKHSPSQPAPLSLQERWAKGHRGAT